MSTGLASLARSGSSYSGGWFSRLAPSRDWKVTNPDFKDLLAALSAAEVRFLIVGGYAVTYHGHPRFTKDLDVWVDRDGDSPQRVYSALESFGAPLADVTEADFANPDVVYQVGVPPNRVDVLTSVSGVAFAQAWEQRVASTYGGVPVHYMSKQDLIANKRSSGRPQDLIDADSLERSD